MRQSHTIYYKQWKDYFDYIQVDITVPEIILSNRMFISDDLCGKIFIDRDYKGLSINATSKIGYTIDRHKKTFDLILFGFGIKVLRQWSY